MQKLPKVLLLAGALGLALSAGIARAEDPPAAAAPAETPEHSFTGKAALYTEYEYRGISQTSEKPAVQLNLDYAHKSGLYIGTFLSNIKWLKDTAEVNGFNTSANLEWDIYGGYKFEVVKDVTLDVG
ncbi:MAG TPA: TorF family putative porin, partial [Usitatibacter sp.]